MKPLLALGLTLALGLISSGCATSPSNTLTCEMWKGEKHITAEPGEVVEKWIVCLDRGHWAFLERDIDCHTQPEKALHFPDLGPGCAIQCGAEDCKIHCP